MNFAMIVDSVNGVKSYYIKDNKGYDFDNNPYGFNVSIGNEFYHSMWSYPALYDGCFLNWKDWEDELPDLDLDLIFLSIEKLLSNPVAIHAAQSVSVKSKFEHSAYSIFIFSLIIWLHTLLYPELIVSPEIL